MPGKLELKSKAETRTADCRLEIKALSDDGTFEGYGSVFGVEDSYSDIVAKGAFTASLADHRKAGTFPALLWQHHPHKPVGVYTEMKEDDKGLYVKGKLALDTQGGKEAYALLKMGALSGLSIGFRSLRSELDEETGVRTLTEIDLWEVSLVTFPALDVARVEGVKAHEQISGLDSLKSAEKYLRDEGGFSARAATGMVARIKRLLDDEREARAARVELNMSTNRLLDLMKM